jgi:hypothetical protein
MTSSKIKIGDVGMLSYRLPAVPVVSASFSQNQPPRRSYSTLDHSDQSSVALKWELASRTKVLANDPLGLLNPVSSTPASLAPAAQRASSFIHRPFANALSPQIESKTVVKDEDAPSILNLPMSITQLRARLNQTSISALTNAKHFSSIKSFALDRLSDLKTTVKSTTIPLTQSKSLYTVKNSNLIKERNLTRNNSNQKLRGSLSSLNSQQSSNSSTLNTHPFSALEYIGPPSDDSRVFQLDSSNSALQFAASLDNRITPSKIVEMSSCHRCTACHRFLYDEEIMSGWSPDDSELHTNCLHCGERTIPNLTIHIKVIQWWSVECYTCPDIAFRIPILISRS